LKEETGVSRQWYYKLRGQEMGPVSGQVLKQLVDVGILTPETPTRTESGDWTIAGRIRGLFESTVEAQSVDSTAVVAEVVYNAKSNRLPPIVVAGLVLVGALSLLFLAVVVAAVFRRSEASASRNAYLRIADEFDATATYVELQPTQDGLEGRKAYIAGIWPSETTPTERTKLVAMGQLQISLAIATLGTDSESLRHKTASNLRNVAARLRQSVR
jgi:hypothetical protein